MPITKLQRNWTAVTFATVVVTKITSVAIDIGGKLLKFFGDADVFPSTICAQDSEPTVKVEGSDVAGLNGWGGPGTTGTFSATTNDALGVTLGGIVWTVINCVMRNPASQGAHGQFGVATVDFDAFASDGLTNPVSFTRV